LEDNLPVTDVALKAVGLIKRFGDVLAVDNLTLEVFSGEVLGLLGPNGAGKTTTLNMLVGLLKPDEGKVFLRGKPVTGSRTITHTRLGVCPQDTILWGRLTCLEQLQFIGEMYGMRGIYARQRGEYLLEILELSEKRKKRASTLSGGMKRRLNLAMSLVHDPEILLLDEPEAGLDPQSRVLVREYIKSLACEKTIILTTHNMDEADRMSDRVAIIDHGKLLVVDTPQAIKGSMGVGDVVEIELKGENGVQKTINQALKHLEERISINFTSGNLILRGADILQVLPTLVDSLKSAGLGPGEIRLRENTLEDVFIQLTGRRLRE
jgi:ABC-2 type transport system ATP-binding protein